MKKEEFFRRARVVEDFPKEGIKFLDISPVLASNEALEEMSDDMFDALYKQGYSDNVDKVVLVEARGFVTGSLLAESIAAGIVMARKKGKLPGKVETQEYQKEYGTDEVQIQAGLIKPGETVVIHDDILATGGTLAAVIDLVKKFNPAKVVVTVLAEIPGLNGRRVLQDKGVELIVIY